MSTRADSLLRAAAPNPSQRLCFTVISTSGGEELVLTIKGALDLGLARPLWQLSDSGTRAYTSYVIDLTEVDDVFGSGLACLIMFVRRVHGRGGQVRVLAGSGQMALARRCAQLLSPLDA
ncbi:MAG: hypothetical protein GWN84_17715 [Gammaproteobacteria bacterium]|nr:hypothetical protein [Gammaproteobacteria bacterium]NIR88941.1 hypothetical protein [Gammaproteobacteria bacterium]NIU05230.1 hypothetical protein [Gammaproteobacteria bacterium]NIV52845.1 hypothetical protein [Gammaproteobacteria bacterium]NIW85141.1 hypothetical protein [Gammaproteobacteria bacterium]